MWPQTFIDSLDEAFFGIKILKTEMIIDKRCGEIIFRRRSCYGERKGKNLAKMICANKHAKELNAFDVTEGGKKAK